MLRDIRIISPRSDIPSTFSTTVDTWNDLKAELESRGINLESTKCMFQDALGNKSDAGGRLPDGTSLTLMIVTEKQAHGK